MPKFTVKCSCPKCGAKFEENIHIHFTSEITEGGSVDTDCPECGSVIDGTPFVVVGVWNYRTCQTEYRPEKELIDIYHGTFKIKHNFK